MLHQRVSLDDWLPRFPLQTDYEHYSANIITGPGQLCLNEQLRRETADEYEWGESVPVDIFVMAEGEPDDRRVTKIGGLPFRPASAPWPVDRDGKPMYFVGQVNFTDSRAIVPKLPGDLLLIFADEFIDDCLDALTLEWRFNDETDLIRSEQLPENTARIAPCYGHIYRTVNYPQARRADARASGRYPQCRGLPVWSEYHLRQYQATQIGAAPFFIQSGDAELPGTPLCTISSVGPDQHSPFPWINHPEPLLPEDDWNFSTNHLMLGDTGCIYINLDETGQLHWGWSCY